MAANDESARPLTAPVVLGEDLSRLSEQELAERIALLQAEVLRVTAERDARGGVRAAADAVFRK
jgi:uncharacterized small protein (DUF1192 family)